MKKLAEGLVRCMHYDSRIGLPLAMLDFEATSAIKTISTDGRCILYNRSGIKETSDDDLDVLLLHVWLNWTRGWVGKSIDEATRTVVAHFAITAMLPNLKPSSREIRLETVDEEIIRARVGEEHLGQNRQDWQEMLTIVERALIDRRTDSLPAPERVDSWSDLRPRQRLERIISHACCDPSNMETMNLDGMTLPLLESYQFVLSQHR